MLKWWLKITIYIFSFIFSLIGLSALDYNRFLKPNKVVSAQLLYFLLALALSYLVGQFFISTIYVLNF